MSKDRSRKPSKGGGRKSPRRSNNSARSGSSSPLKGHGLQMEDAGSSPRSNNSQPKQANSNSRGNNANQKEILKDQSFQSAKSGAEGGPFSVITDLMNAVCCNCCTNVFRNGISILFSAIIFALQKQFDIFYLGDFKRPQFNIPMPEKPGRPSWEYDDQEHDESVYMSSPRSVALHNWIVDVSIYQKCFQFCRSLKTCLVENLKCVARQSLSVFLPLRGTVSHWHQKFKSGEATLGSLFAIIT